MRLFITLFLVILCIHVSAQTYVKVADKPEYTKYLAYCNEHDWKTFEYLGKIPVLKVNGIYTDAEQKYYAKEPFVVTWIKPGTTSVLILESEKLITVKITVQVRRRTPTIPDFYAVWMTHRLP